jgi:hypothetical protein
MDPNSSIVHTTPGRHAFGSETCGGIFSVLQWKLRRPGAAQFVASLVSRCTRHGRTRHEIRVCLQSAFTASKRSTHYSCYSYSDPGPTWQCWNAWLTRHAIPIRPHTLLHNPFPMCRRFRRPTNLSISKQLSLSSLSAQRRTAAGRDPPGLPSPLRLRCPAFPSPLPSQLS